MISGKGLERFLENPTVENSSLTVKEFKELAHNTLPNNPFEPSLGFYHSAISLLFLGSPPRNIQFPTRSHKRLKKILVFCAATAIAPIAAVELTFDMAGTSIDDARFVHGPKQDQSLYAGELVVSVGVRNMVVNFAGGTINFAWALDLTDGSFGAGVFYLSGAVGPYAPGSQDTFNIEHDVSGYRAQVLAANFYGDWNAGTFIGSDIGDDAVSVSSGEMYYILDTTINVTDSGTTVALLGLGFLGLVGMRRKFAK
ncbi:MAG: hypothetical protein ACI92G_002902 [Candidatus Pelagisphaera sp.]